ncbi:MAG: ThuA domain-containing protein [Pirellulales bacterium]|nr:ThuA domain-containing protein [Pirellulales bacterium]
MKGIRYRRLAAVAVIAACILSYRSAPAEDKAVRVLLVTGVDYQGHPWKETAPAVRAVLEKDSRLEVRIVDDLEFLASEVIFDYDVLLLHFKNYDVPKRSEKVQENLVRFAQEGGGVVLFHFACGAFEQWPGYLDLAGRVWDKAKRAHDPRGPFTVKVVDHEHPVTRGLGDFEIEDELYTCLGGDRPIHVLATARSKVDGQDYPMAFVHQFGEGKVFHTVMGHDVKAVGAAGLDRLLQNACLWTAGRLP